MSRGMGLAERRTQGRRESEMTGEAMIEKLRDRGLKITPQRRAIIDILVEQRPLHPSAPQVFREAEKKGKPLSLSTVYATLHEFSRHGLIKTLEFDQMENRYEMNLEEHINLICEGCGKIIDYPVPPSVDQGTLTKATGFRVRKTRMEYYGCCRECLPGGSTGKPCGGKSRGGKACR
jgi:Fur family peroxide stress response transcriptional regulator